MITWLLIGFIDLYKRFLSPWLPRSCRYHPSCSQYTRQAIVVYGPLRGVWWGFWRIARCHGLFPGGLDPVLAPGQKPPADRAYNWDDLRADAWHRLASVFSWLARGFRR